MEKKRCIEAELQKTYVRWRWLLIFVWVISFTEVGLMWWVMYNLHNGHAIIVSLVFIVTVFLPVSVCVKSLRVAICLFRRPKGSSS